MDPNEARAALASMDEARAAFARSEPDYPLWRHTAFALIMAVITLSQGLGVLVKLPVLAIAMAFMAWLVTDDRRRYGLFVSGYRRGRTLPLTLGLVAFVLIAMGGELYAYYSDLSLLIRFAIAGVVFAVSLGASIAWTRIYQRELMKPAA